MSEFVRRATRRFVEVTPGDEEALFDDVVIGLAEVLGLTVAARWDVARGAEPPTRRLRWVREGAGLKPPRASTLHADNPFVELATTATEPIVLDDDDALAEHGLLSESPQARLLSRLLVPGRSDASVECVLVLTRPAGRPWLGWEMAMLAQLAELIPVVRARIDTERRIAASFEAAPIGMTLRTAEHRLVEHNVAFGELLGVHDGAGEAGQLVGRDWLELVDREIAADDVVESLRQPPSDGHRRLEVPFRHLTGCTVWARVAETRIDTQHGDRWLSFVEDVTEQRRRQAVIERRAAKDALTGLANRHELLDVLSSRLTAPADPGGRAACAVVVIDLDGFKHVNDVHGHAAGDAVLVAVGRRLDAISRGSDLVARYGGDEFVVVLAGPIDERDALRVGEKLATVSTAPIAHGAVELTVGAAVGVAVGRAGDVAASVIERADAAMYEVKRRRRPGAAAPAVPDAVHDASYASL